MKLPSAHRSVIITDDKVRSLHALTLQKQWQAQGHRVDLLSFPAGEASKNRDTKAKLEDELFALGCGKDTQIIAVGGGVVGDLAGFVASTYMRGIPVVHFPTTLLAMVDSSIGGKNGVNTAYGKNLLGTYWPAKEVQIHLEFLKTLPQEHFISGMVEALKVFLTHDRSSFEWLQKNLQLLLQREENALRNLVDSARKIKLGIVERDAQEKGERNALNFGHTVGHALEHLSAYQLNHGHAVALGILVESQMAQQEGHLSQEAFLQIKNLIQNLKLDLAPLKQWPSEVLFEAMQLDKKTQGSIVQVLVLKAIGEVFCREGQWTQPLQPRDLERALETLNQTHVSQ